MKETVEKIYAILQQISLTDEDKRALANQFNNIKNFTLNIGSHPKLAGDEAVMRIAEALKNNTTLISLVISEKSITATGAKALADVVKSNNTLKSLIINEGNIGGEGAIALAEALEENNTLTTLKIQGNDIGESGATALATLLRTTNTLATLIIHDNNIGERGTIALANALRINKTLITLGIDRNNIRLQGVQVLALALRMNGSLENLIISGNGIDDVGAAALAETLAINKALKKLTLSENKIDKRGAEKIALALRKNETLTTLSLHSNNIGDDGVRALAAALIVNKMLQELRLENNAISDEAREVLAAALYNTTLVSIAFSCNEPIDFTGECKWVGLLASAVEKNPGLIKVDIDCPGSMPHQFAKENYKRIQRVADGIIEFSKSKGEGYQVLTDTDGFPSVRMGTALSDDETMLQAYVHGATEMLYTTVGQVTRTLSGYYTYYAGNSSDPAVEVSNETLPSKDSNSVVGGSDETLPSKETPVKVDEILECINNAQQAIQYVLHTRNRFSPDQIQQLLEPFEAGNIGTPSLKPQDVTGEAAVSDKGKEPALT